MPKKIAICLLCALVHLALGPLGGGPVTAQGPVDEGMSPPPSALPGTKVARYPRLAIVTAVGTGSSPEVGPIILNGVSSVTSKYLGFLQKVDCLPNVPVDLTTSPPLVKLPTLGQYDAVAVLVHSQTGGKIYVDINVFDARTGVSLWTQQLHGKEDNVSERFRKLGVLVPKRLMKYFYRD